MLLLLPPSHRATTVKRMSEMTVATWNLGHCGTFLPGSGDSAPDSRTMRGKNWRQRLWGFEDRNWACSVRPKRNGRTKSRRVLMDFCPRTAKGTLHGNRVCRISFQLRTPKRTIKKKLRIANNMCCTFLADKDFRHPLNQFWSGRVRTKEFHWVAPTPDSQKLLIQ